jgi:hypothetical protein
MATQILQLELKYCERCGTLWLRLRGSDVVVCRSCARALAGVPGWPSRERAGGMEETGPAPVESAFWGEGGNA